MRSSLIIVGGVVACFSLHAADEPVVFRSDVALVRVDAQVVDRTNRAVTGLQLNDFLLYEEGKQQQIRNFSNENMPVDVLVLLDVSASMRPHVQRIADAAHDALRVLGEQDRVAIMVFDRSTRVRLPFRSSRDDVQRELERLLSQESFNGGTDITRGILDAAKYIAREARPDARRAIVILTDDQTERERNEAACNRELARADAVLSLLLAPDAMRNRSIYSPGSGGRYPRGGGGGGWPGAGGGGMGGPPGGVIFGRRGPYGGGPGGPGVSGPHTHSAGTAEIARQSGGDDMPVDDAGALENTLSRIRQRYTLHFLLPEGAKAGQERNIEVQLAAATQRRYPGAEVRYRRVYYSPTGNNGTPAASTEPVQVSRAPANPAPAAAAGDASDPDRPVLRRRPAVSQPDSGPRGPLLIDRGQPGNSGTQGTSTSAPAQAQTDQQSGWPKAEQPSQGGGWRRARPDEK